MTKGELYKKAPIREAIFDIRFDFDKQPEHAVFESVFSEVKNNYPKREVISAQTLMFEVKPGEKPVVNSSHGENGLKLTSTDGTKIVQIRPDGFTFSQLKPYLGWDVFMTDVKPLFELYVSKTQPKNVNRIALRYINAIEISETSFNLEDYFSTHPKIADSLPQGLIQFFYRVVIKDDKTDNTFAIVNQTVEESPTPTKGISTVIFDIDVFQPVTKLEPNSETFWSEIENLKTLRTKIFNESITQKTKDLFN